MKKFEIDGWSKYTNPITGHQQRDRFLSVETIAFYHDDYHAGDSQRRETVGTVEFVITKLKNQFKDTSLEKLQSAINSLATMFLEDLPQILKAVDCKNITICVIPRAKAEKNYENHQRLFKTIVSEVANYLDDFTDGTSFILRHTNTRTTHLERSGYGGDGHLPYPGITKNTCTISKDVSGKNILLIDDLYTKDVGIDEDAIQALLDHGANSVIFYAIGKTLKN